MRFAHDYLDNQEVKREEYFLLPTSSLLTRLPACSFFNNVFYKGVPKYPKVVRLRATFLKVCTKYHKIRMKHHIDAAKTAETGFSPISADSRNISCFF